MAIYIGNTQISKVFKGSTEITKLFQGSNAAYSSTDSGTIFYLVIAGGGAGGGGPRYFNGGGGGGAGGYLSSSLASIASGSSITVVVGAGGAGAQTGGGDGGDSSLTSAAGSSFTTVTADGGGGGSSQVSGQTPGDGGSGGGAVYHSPSQAGGSATAGQGNDGGDVNFSNVGGAGGGGKGSAGQTLNSSDGFIAGDGGNGEASSITGTSVTRAGGGGGGNYAGMNSDFGTGGTGGGGDGSANGTGTAGTTNLGGGGGGSGNFSSGNSGGAGGSGVVILAYDSGSISAAGGIAKARSDGYVYHTFNSSGTLTVGSQTDFTTLNGENFNAITYVGDRPTNAGKTGMGFQPDLVIIKGRSFSDHWSVLDVLRGANVIGTNQTDAETSFSGFTFDSDGFTVGSSGQANSNGETHIGWGWKAGGSGVSNTDGTITSTVSANPAAGFSIVKYTGSGYQADGTSTVGHGLGAKPRLIIQKRLNSTQIFYAITDIVTGSPQYVQFDTSAAANITAPTNFQITDSVFTNWESNGNDIINYCFADVAGYQKIGTYSGTGSSLEITVGFKPRFVMIKRVASSGDRWLVVDSFRGGDTNNDSFLDFQDTLSERDMNATNGLTFNSNSFTINTTDGALNNSAGTYLYWAIA